MYFENARYLFLSLIGIIPLLALAWELRTVKKTGKFVFRTKDETVNNTKILKLRVVVKNLCYFFFWLSISVAFSNPY